MTITEQKKTEIYREYKEKVYAYLINKLRNKENAEDLCADVFVKVYSHLAEFDEAKAKLSTWIYRITQNTLFDYYRTSHIHCELDENIPDGSDVEDKICNDETLVELTKALKLLSERERDIIILHYYKHMTLKEVAEKMNMSYSNMKIVHAKALKEMQAVMRIARFVTES